MDKRLSIIAGVGIGLGAAAMYFLDPDRGARRRNLVRDKTTHVTRQVSHAADIKARNLANQIHGLAAEARGLLTRREIIDDVVVERVRAKLGRLVSHPSAVEVHANNGRVTLSGRVPSDEIDHLICRVGRIRGVVGIENALEEMRHASEPTYSEHAHQRA